MLRVLIFEGRSSTPRLIRKLADPSPGAWMSFFKKTCLILVLDLLVIGAMLEDPALSLAGLAV